MKIIIYYENINSLLMKNYSSIPSDFLIFKDIMREQLKKNYMDVYKTLVDKCIMNDNIKELRVSIYRIVYIINYDRLLKDYVLFCNNLNLHILK